MKTTEIPLEENKFYHIYNRGNNRGNIFYNSGNYEFFLRKFDEYLSEFIDTYAFCLLPNHFHFLIGVKDIKVPPFRKVEPLSNQISFQFRRFFTSYSMAINKQQNRTGSLFQKNFKRKEITNQNYLSRLVFYIHANPQMHGIVDDFRMYPWSSYERILKRKPSKLKKEEVLEWYNDKSNYIAYHSQNAELAVIKDLILE